MNCLGGVALQSLTRQSQKVSVPPDAYQKKPQNSNVGYKHRQFAVIETISSPDHFFRDVKDLPADSGRKFPTVPSGSEWIKIARRKTIPVPSTTHLSTFQPIPRPANKHDPEGSRCLITQCNDKRQEPHHQTPSYRYPCSLPAIPEDPGEPFPS